MSRTDDVAILGAGAWGTALAAHLGAQGKRVRLWAREPELRAALVARRENASYLPGVVLPASVSFPESIAAAVEGTALVVAAAPSAFARALHRQLAPSLAASTAVVTVAKGIEEDTLALPLEVAAQELGGAERLAVLSGPSFAAEVARGNPTAVVVAARRAEIATLGQQTFAAPTLRAYTTDDTTGVQLAGALKNVIAIAAGLGDGLGLGANAQAALVTRGLAEITRLGRALGGRASTFAGLAGLGDLVLTCTGGLSRNRSLGQRLGRGERLQDILCAVPHEVEGVRTTRAALALARRTGVEMPIVEALHGVLFDGALPAHALASLMGRPLTAEADGEG